MPAAHAMTVEAAMVIVSVIVATSSSVRDASLLAVQHQQLDV